MDGNKIMDLLKDSMAVALPDRIITRSVSDFANRPQKEILCGVITLVSADVDKLDTARSFADLTGTLRILIAGDLKLKEGACGEEVERAEWAMFQEIFEFIKAPGLGLCPLDMSRVQFSGQNAAPFGWILVEATYSELD